MKKPKLLVIVGPTSAGKSALAIELAKKFNGEILSADSRQVYRGLDIGTGKVTKKEMRGVPHHLLDIASPKRAVTAYEFSQKGRAAIRSIIARNSLPVVIGGTGFYIDALLGDVALPNVPPDKKLRTKLQKKTTAQLFALLKKKDSRRANMMNTPSERNNKVRLIRALEIATHANVASSHSKEASYDVLRLGIAPAEKELERRIRARLKARIRRGMITEAAKLHSHGLSYKRMRELGLEYRSLARLLQRKISRKDFEEELYREIRRYAKKQLMYWKRNENIRWFDPEQKAEIKRTVKRWLQ